MRRVGARGVRRARRRRRRQCLVATLATVHRRHCLSRRRSSSGVSTGTRRTALERATAGGLTLPTDALLEVALLWLWLLLFSLASLSLLLKSSSLLEAPYRKRLHGPPCWRGVVTASCTTTTTTGSTSSATLTKTCRRRRGAASRAASRYAGTTLSYARRACRCTHPPSVPRTRARCVRIRRAGRWALRGGMATGCYHSSHQDGLPLRTGTRGIGHHHSPTRHYHYHQHDVLLRLVVVVAVLHWHGKQYTYIHKYAPRPLGPRLPPLALLPPPLLAIGPTTAAATASALLLHIDAAAARR